MENKKKVYETPEVTKVEFDASDRITASGCTLVYEPGLPNPVLNHYD